MQRYEHAFTRLVAGVVDLAQDEVLSLIRMPEAGRGDIALPCFSLARKLRKNPAAIAADIVAALPDDPHFASVEADGPYVNAYIDSGHLVRALVPEIRRHAERFAHDDVGDGSTVVIDYSSPNIAKPLGFHHLRSTMIGNALLLIHRALGYRVEGINFLGDWGKTFGLLAEAFERFGDDDDLRRDGISYLLQLYIKANEAAGSDADFDEAARAMFRRQEQGDERALELWRLFRTISLNEFEGIYARLGVRFESVDGESRYREGMEAVIDAIHDSVGTREDQGALVVDMDYAEGEPPMMLRKSDGATLYATRDVAAALDRWERFSFSKSLYVVGVEQRRHFDQLKRALTAMGREWAQQMTHVEFGRVQGMSTRRGKVVFLEEVIDEARDRARAKMADSADERELDLEEVAEQVGVGGVVFGDLKNLRASDYSFDWEEILNPRGFTGICVQYAHARCCSMLRKAGGAPVEEDVDFALLDADEEVALVKDLSRIPGAVRAAADELEPSRLARAVYEAARSWNRYQQAGSARRELRVLTDDVERRNARLALVDATRIGLKVGLELLGVPTPQAM